MKIAPLLRAGLCAFAIASLAACATTNDAAPVSASAAPSGALRLERVVFVMRHGIRPPTKDPARGDNYARDPWPSWPVDWGLLTPRGEAGIRLLGEADRIDYVRRGLLPAQGCLPEGAIVAKASAKQRAIRTGEAYVETLLPGCGVAVVHPEREGPEDWVFHPLDSGPADFDGAEALRQAEALAPPGGIEAEAAARRGEIELLARVLGCGANEGQPTPGSLDPCTLVNVPSRLAGNPHDRPDLEGPLGIGSTVSQTFLLEYLEGKPMSEVGWDRVTREEIERLLIFHPVKFRYENGSRLVARRAAGPLVREMQAALGAPEGPRFMLLFGHDTNVADIGSLLGLTWQVPSYPRDDIPPGGALGFELLSGANGHRYVRAFFRAQTMDQLRNQERLDPAAPGYRIYLSIPGCDAGGGDPAPCPLERFDAIVERALAG
jgi:4-phytase/acid phosphatase